MIGYLGKRILIIVPTFLGITVLVYFLANLMPGIPWIFSLIILI
jgi:ABC-type dipeptide/oligopeptide/nickel transport system permease component